MNFIKRITLSILIALVLCSTSAIAREMKIVQISDVHLETQKPDKAVRKFNKSLSMFQKAIFKTNILGPNIVVFSGDMVNRPIPSEFDIFLKNAKKLHPEFYPIFGNHDVGVAGGLSKELIIKKLNDNCPWLSIQQPNYYKIKDDYIFIFMDGTTDQKITSTGTFSKESLNFLDNTLSEYKDKKAIIIQHFPLITPFKSTSHEITNKTEYFEVLDKHQNVIMVLAGHFHASKAVERNNVLHVTTPSMIEYPHAFRYLTVNEENDKIIIQSKIFPDREQNSYENDSQPVNMLKLGRNSDNFFTIILKNNIEKSKRESLWKKLKK